MQIEEGLQKENDLSISEIIKRNIDRKLEIDNRHYTKSEKAYLIFASIMLTYESAFDDLSFKKSTTNDYAFMKFCLENIKKEELESLLDTNDEFLTIAEILYYIYRSLELDKDCYRIVEESFHELETDDIIKEKMHALAEEAYQLERNVRKRKCE